VGVICIETGADLVLVGFSFDCVDV
jgi:hypothetical protein